MNCNDPRTLVRTRLPVLLAAAVLAMPLAAMADGATPVDTSRWKCKFCEFDKGFSGSAELGAGYVSEDSFKFGEYNGLAEQGGFPVGAADARYRNEDGSWFDLTAADLGLDTRFLSAAGGRQGIYRLSLSYRELSHYITESAVTPFTGVGSGSLALPGGWVAAGDTGTMTALAGSLRGVELETHRRRLDLGASLTPFSHWEFGVRYRREARTGERGTSATFEINAAQLVMPVDYVTDEFDASAAYSGERLQMRLAYYGSLFTNQEPSLTWSNPYVPLSSGGTAGQLALAPSNQFHQLSLAGGFRLGARTSATADVALGRMTQDEPFLAATLNPNLAVALPRNSLDGTVDTLSARFRLTSSVTDQLRLNASASYDDRNNRTPQATYERVNTDTYAALPRTNQPYSFTRTALRLSGDYYVTRSLRLGGGYDYDIRERDLQDIGKTREGMIWGRLGAQISERVELTLKATHGERNVSDYAPNPEIVPPNNPLMRKYNMADRSRDTAEFRADIVFDERLSVGLAGSVARDDYAESLIGLLDDHQGTLTADGTLTLGESTTATAYLNHEEIRSHQSNADGFNAAPMWSASNRDRIDTGGIGIQHKISDDLDAGVDYTVSYSQGRVSVSTATTPFPDLTSRLGTVKVHATYHLRPAISLRLAWWYESYETADWMLDGVLPDTLSKVLAFGQGSPSYHVNVVTLSGRYAF